MFELGTRCVWDALFAFLIARFGEVSWLSPFLIVHDPAENSSASWLLVIVGVAKEPQQLCPQQISTWRWRKNHQLVAQTFWNTAVFGFKVVPEVFSPNVCDQWSWLSSPTRHRLHFALWVPLLRFIRANISSPSRYLNMHNWASQGHRGLSPATYQVGNRKWFSCPAIGACCVPSLFGCNYLPQ